MPITLGYAAVKEQVCPWCGRVSRLTTFVRDWSGGDENPAVYAVCASCADELLWSEPWESRSTGVFRSSLADQTA